MASCTRLSHESLLFAIRKNASLNPNLQLDSAFVPGMGALILVLEDEHEILRMEAIGILFRNDCSGFIGSLHESI